MNLRKIPLPIKGFLLGLLISTCFVVFAWGIYPIKNEGWEAAGFLLLFFGLPSSMLLNFYNGPVIMQILLLSVFGYLQWPLFGLIIGTVVWVRKKKRSAGHDSLLTSKK
jgi:TM2 domain-containing membrane protein YozV